MIEYNKASLGRIAKEHGFVRDTFEKVLRLKEILSFINEHEGLESQLALKGGTAINMAIFNLPRLSVDIDMDFMTNFSKEKMLIAREQITQLLKKYMSEEGYVLSEASRYSHSLDSFLLQYQNAGGNRDSIKIEINYSLRSHIFPAVKQKCLPDIFKDSVEINMLEAIEIFAAKANALMSRAAARDLYDFTNMINNEVFKGFEEELLRKCIVFYASISAAKINKTFNTSAIDKLDFTKIRRDLFPVIKEKDNFDLEERKIQAKSFIERIMVLTPTENEYLETFEANEYRPELLFSDKDILKNIHNHPMALWKMEK